MMDDLMLMLIIFMERGNNFTKIINSSSPELADIVRSLRDAYNIKDSTTKGTNRRQVITLARIAATYPWNCCEVMPFCRNPVVTKARVDDFIRRHNRKVSTDYPIFMYSSPITAMIPTDREHNTLVELYVGHVAFTLFSHT